MPLSPPVTIAPFTGELSRAAVTVFAAVGYGIQSGLHARNGLLLRRKAHCDFPFRDLSTGRLYDSRFVGPAVGTSRSSSAGGSGSRHSSARLGRFARTVPPIRASIHRLRVD